MFPAQAASIHDAVDKHNMEQVRRLLAEGIEVDARDTLGRTALHWAAREGYGDIAVLLLDRGAAAERRREWGDRRPADRDEHGCGDIGHALGSLDGAGLTVVGEKLDKEGDRGRGLSSSVVKGA